MVAALLVQPMHTQKQPYTTIYDGPNIIPKFNSAVNRCTQIMAGTGAESERAVERNLRTRRLREHLGVDVEEDDNDE